MKLMLWFVAILALLALIYLVVAMLWPEKFSA